jgi:DME family drug/metabolite transporter
LASASRGNLGAASAGGASGDIYGIACGVAGGCFGVYTVSAKRLIQGNVNMQAAVPVTLLLGGAVLAPWTLPELPELVTPRSLDLIAWLGPVSVALAYWLYVAGLRGLTAATAGSPPSSRLEFAGKPASRPVLEDGGSLGVL